MLKIFLSVSILFLYFCIAFENVPNAVHSSNKDLLQQIGKKEYGKNPLNFEDQDSKRTTLEIIRNKGYAGEEHHVVTKDGYILGLHRIPAPKGQTHGRFKRPVVLLQHGLESCSFIWVANLENQSLGFILADAGFDVWLANSRGNMYSINHSHLSTKSQNFWKFSWDHMAKYDLPANVEYILNRTGNQQLYYVGHSQGTLIGFAQFSTDLEFAKKIKAFFALAPVAHIGHVVSKTPLLHEHVKDLQIFFQKYGYYQFLPNDGLLHDIEKYSCSDQTLHVDLCQKLYLAHIGPDVQHYNKTRIPVYTAHCPSGTSTQNMAHFAQMVNSNLFQKYDYTINDAGRLNQIHYGQKTPPLYDPSKLNVPTIMFHSDKDNEANPIDVAWLLSQINHTVVENYHYHDLTHSDFTLAMNAADDVYSHILNYIYKSEMSSFFHY